MVIRHQSGKHDQKTHGNWAMGGAPPAIVEMTVSSLAPGTEFVGEGWTASSVMQAAAGIAKVRERFPKAPSVQQVETASADEPLSSDMLTSGAFAGVNTGDRMRRIFVHPDFHDDDKVAARKKEFDDNPRMLVSASRSSDIVHEYGHIMHMSHSARDLESAIANYQYATEAVDIPGMGFKTARFNAGPFAPSLYAVGDLDEYMAESVTDYVVNGDNAKESSKTIAGGFHEAYGTGAKSVTKGKLKKVG